MKTLIKEYRLTQDVCAGIPITPEFLKELNNKLKEKWSKNNSSSFKILTETDIVEIWDAGGWDWGYEHNYEKVIIKQSKNEKEVNFGEYVYTFLIKEFDKQVEKKIENSDYYEDYEELLDEEYIKED